jgi:hypothetical protein
MPDQERDEAKMEMDEEVDSIISRK